MLSRRKPIVVVGSINMDIVANADRIPISGETVVGMNLRFHPGGKGANQAVAVARLGFPVQMIGRVGSDQFGIQLRADLEHSGVDLIGVTSTEGSSGVALIVVSSQGENSIVVTPGTNALLAPEDLEASISIIRNAGLILTQLEISVETVTYLSWLCERENIPLILDPAPAAELPKEMFRRIAWLTPNEIEARFYAADGAADELSSRIAPERVVRSLRTHGASGVIVKMGENGVYLADPNTNGKYLKALEVQAVDSTAAGDAFNGAFAVGLMQGKSPFESANFATAAAAITVTRAGAQPSLPTFLEVEEVLKQARLLDVSSIG